MKKNFWILLLLLIAASVVVEFTIHHHGHNHYWFMDIPLFWILFGLAGAVLMILFAKKILAPIVYRGEDYYG